LKKLDAEVWGGKEARGKKVARVGRKKEKKKKILAGVRQNSSLPGDRNLPPTKGKKKKARNSIPAFEGKKKRGSSTHQEKP